MRLLSVNSKEIHKSAWVDDTYVTIAKGSGSRNTSFLYSPVADIIVTATGVGIIVVYRRRRTFAQ